MPTEKEGGNAPPPPESPLWLPSLAARGASPGQHGRTHGHSHVGYTLPKARHLPAGGSKDASGLFSMSTLPTLESLELPGARRDRPKVLKGSPSAPCMVKPIKPALSTILLPLLMQVLTSVPKLPSIGGSNGGSPRAGLGRGGAATKQPAASQRATAREARVVEAGADAGSDAGSSNEGKTPGGASCTHRCGCVQVHMRAQVRTVCGYVLFL